MENRITEIETKFINPGHVWSQGSEVEGNIGVCSLVGVNIV